MEQMRETNGTFLERDIYAIANRWIGLAGGFLGCPPSPEWPSQILPFIFVILTKNFSVPNIVLADISLGVTFEITSSSSSSLLSRPELSGIKVYES